MNKKSSDVHKLSDLQSEIREAIRSNFARPRWVVAEINDLNENFSGHCYMDLVEKDENSDNLLAKARATIWASAYRMLKPFFETTTGYELTAGIKIMVSATVEYHPVFGLSLNIKDIDPSYTLGDVEKRRKEIISRLEKEGVIDMNRETDMPLVPQKIAIISSKTAAGYEDFLEQLLNNGYGYKFYTKLFPAVMQGEKTESSIIHALERIFEYESVFDLVVIIRGGGSKSDLASFDTYELAFHVSQFPLPVITGIGHEQDDSIVDLVAHTRLKTPTAVAEFLIDRLASFEANLDEYSEFLVRASQTILREKEIQLQMLGQKISSASIAFTVINNEILLKTTSNARHLVQQTISEHSIQLLKTRESMKNSVRNIADRKKMEAEFLNGRMQKMLLNRFEQEEKRLENYEKLRSYADPSQILKFGFSISRAGGKALKDSSVLNKDDLIETQLYKGKIKSRVTDIEKKLYIRKTKEDTD